MRLCGTEIKRGEKKEIKLMISEAVSISVVLFCGQNEGKTLVVTGGVHGCEYVGIEAIRRFLKEVDPKELNGNLIVIPIVNREGFLYGAKQIVPEDQKNLNRVFPGSNSGSISERMAYAIEKEVYPYADFIIDLHGGDCNESLHPLVFFSVMGNKIVNKVSLQAAKCLSVPYRVRSTAKNGLYSWAVQKGIPALLIERGSGGVWSEEEVFACEEDIFRIMVHMGIINREYEYKKQREIVQAIYEEAEYDGFWYPYSRSGAYVKAGEILGRLETYDGKIGVDIKAQFEGIVMYYTTALGVRKEDPLIAYGRV